MTAVQLILRYVSFAMIAIFCNLAVQRMVLSFDNSHLGFVAAILLGTGIGLIVKFLLDRRFIFLEKSKNTQHQSQQFLLYATTGIFTTALFWITETFFWWLYATTHAREIGAILGLGIGYFVKYRLDRRFVFTSSAGGP